MNDQERFVSLLTEHFSAYGGLSAAQSDALYRHYELLARWNRVLNLTSIRKMDEAVLRHYCESLFLGNLLPPEPVSVLDAGSGGGFPGIPMAVLRPDCRFVLAESHQRKAVFLREATREYGNVRIWSRRAEESEEHFDWVVSRAVAWLELEKIAGRLGDRVAVLAGAADANDARQSQAFEWENPKALPWGDRRVVLLGRNVPRGTF